MDNTCGYSQAWALGYWGGCGGNSSPQRSPAPAAAVANGATWGYLRDLNAVLCFPHPPVHPLNSVKQRVRAFLSKEAVVWLLPALWCFFWGCEAQKWWGKCPRRCEGKNSPAGVTQAWLCGGLEYVRGYSHIPTLKSADHISNVYYSCLIAWIKYLKTVSTASDYRLTAEESQGWAAGHTSCFFSIKWGHIIFLWDTFGTGAI